MEKDSTEERILEAARSVFVSKGLAGARMQDIADAAGINKALLHYYFRSKEKLFEQIFKEVSVHFFPRIMEIFDEELSLFEKIRRLAEEYIDQLKATPYLPVFIINEINRQPEAFIEKMWKGRKPPIYKFVAQVKEEIEAGHIRPVDPIQLFLHLLSLCVFPFLARPIFETVGGISRQQFEQLLEQRKREIPEFIIHSIRKVQ